MALSAKTRIDYIDRPELQETFVDCVQAVDFDGLLIRAELSVTRIDERHQKAESRTLKRYPACRLVMPPQAALDLFNYLQQFLAVMEQRGLVARPRPQNSGEMGLQNPPGVNMQ